MIIFINVLGWIYLCYVFSKVLANVCVYVILISLNSEYLFSNLFLFNLRLILVFKHFLIFTF